VIAIEVMGIAGLDRARRFRNERTSHPTNLE
jgi:hypothetical protein